MPERRNNVVTEEVAAARRREKNRKKAEKRSAKRAERRELERQRREEQEAAETAYNTYVSDAEARYREAQRSNDPKSRSNRLRSEANALYQALDGLAPCLVPSKISQVEGMYGNALKEAFTPLERCSASKNLAALARRTLRLTRADGPTALGLMATALRHYISALVWGAECQTIAWVDDIFSAATELIDTALGWRYSDLVRERPFLEDKWPDQGLVLGRLHAALPLDSATSERSPHVASLKASLSLSYAKHLYGEALDIQDSGNTEQEWRRALDLVGRVQPLLVMAAHNAGRAGNNELWQEAHETLESAEICEAICRSTQARHTGDVMLRRVLNDCEALDMEGVQLVADFYREAVSHARDLDLEAEARAHRALGHLYCNVLRMTDRGLEHYKLVIQMGVAMMPRNVEHTDWYREARQAVLKAQQEVAAAEDRAKQTARTPLLEQLASELEELKKAANKGAYVLVRHVYEKHPPPGLSPDFKVTDEMVMGDKIKDTLRRAVIAYHPDKQVGKPAKWQVLAEEITKELNCKYQCMKG